MAKDGLTFKIDTSGLEKLISQEPAKVDAWLRGVANEIKSDVILSFGTSPAGRKYKRGKKYHVASVKGNPPNVDTGTLKNSLNVQPMGALSYEIRVGTEYAQYLEEGTDKMAARPFFAPVLKAWEGKLEDDAKRNLGLEDV